MRFAERHHDFLKQQVEAGVYATTCAAAAAGMAEEIRRRLETPLGNYLDKEATFASLRRKMKAASVFSDDDARREVSGILVGYGGRDWARRKRACR